MARIRLLMCENSLAGAGRCRALRTLGSKVKSGCSGRYKCKKVEEKKKRREQVVDVPDRESENRSEFRSTEL